MFPWAYIWLLCEFPWADIWLLCKWTYIWPLCEFPWTYIWLLCKFCHSLSAHANKSILSAVHVSLFYLLKHISLYYLLVHIHKSASRIHQQMITEFRRNILIECFPAQHNQQCTRTRNCIYFMIFVQNMPLSCLLLCTNIVNNVQLRGSLSLIIRVLEVPLKYLVDCAALTNIRKILLSLKTDERNSSWNNRLT